MPSQIDLGFFSLAPKLLPAVSASHSKQPPLVLYLTYEKIPARLKKPQLVQFARIGNGRSFNETATHFNGPPRRRRSLPMPPPLIPPLSNATTFFRRK